MTLRERQFALLVDLMNEREDFPAWKAYYDRKIAALKEVLYGSGSGDQAGRGAGVQDVSSGNPQTLRESGDTDGTVSM